LALDGRSSRRELCCIGNIARVPLPDPSIDARAVVTGASHGIGEALATELAARGYHLLVTARRESLLNDLAERLSDKYGVTVDVWPADLTDPTHREKLADELATRNVSILCANAGVATLGPVAELDPAGERALVQLNVVAVHDLILAVLPGMLERGAGGILISGSAAGNSPIPNNAAYSSSKAFLNTFSEALRLELRSTGVHVTLLAPGPVKSGLPDFVEEAVVDKVIPDYMWVSTEYTAKASLNGLRRNKMRVVPGLPAKAMSLVSTYLPRAVLAPIVGNVYKKLGGG
jgi:mycolic acid reductase